MNNYVATLDRGTLGVATIAPDTNGIKFAVAETPVTLDDVTLTAVKTFTITQDEPFGGYIRFILPDVDKMGLVFGFVTSGLNGTPIAGTAPADGVYFIKAPTDTTFVGRVIENSQTADDTGTLLTATDAIEYTLSFYCKPGASAALTQGYWRVEAAGAVTETPFTSAQITALYTMLATTAAELQGTIQGRVSGTTQKSLVVIEADLWSEK